MKKPNIRTVILLSAIVFAVVYACSSGPIAGSFDALADTHAGLGRIEGSSDSYHVSPKFDRIDKVFLKETASAARENEPKILDLAPEDWEFYPERNVLRMKKPFEAARFRIHIAGKMTVPFTILERSPIVADSIKIMLDGRVAVPGKDFIFDEAAGSITIPVMKHPHQISYALKTGGEVMSGDFAVEKMTGAAFRYFGRNMKGNAVAIPGRAGSYDTSAGNLRDVFVVHLLPVRDNETGISVSPKEFAFDPVKQELTVRKTFDPAKYSVDALGSSFETPDRSIAVPYPDEKGMVRMTGAKTLLSVLSMREVTKVEQSDFSDPGKSVTSVIPRTAWNFNPTTQTLTLSEPILKDGTYLLLHGIASRPLTFTSTKPIDPSSIKLVAAGRICRPETDYRFDAEKNAIVILTPDYRENSPDPLLFHFSTYGDADPSDAVISLGLTRTGLRAGSLSRLTPDVVRYVREFIDAWIPVPGTPGAYTLSDPMKVYRLKTITIAEIVSLADGKTGRILKPDEYSFDPDSQILTMEIPVDDGEFIVTAWGERQ